MEFSGELNNARIIWLHFLLLSVRAYEPWTKDEQQRLQHAVLHFIGDSRWSLESFHTLPWTLISTSVGTRNWKQCRLKWWVGGWHIRALSNPRVSIFICAYHPLFNAWHSSASLTRLNLFFDTNLFNISLSCRLWDQLIIFCHSPCL